MFSFLQGLFVSLHVPILTVGVCALDADVCVCKDGETGGAAGRKRFPTGKREREREILEP